MRPLRRARGFSGEAVRNGGKPGEAKRRPRDDGRPESAARRRRRTPDGAPEGATPSQGGVHKEGPSRHPARRPLSSRGREAIFQKLGRICAARTMEYCSMMNENEFVSEAVSAQEIASLAPEDVTRIRKEADRWRAQMLCLWKLCPKAACRKARCCSGDPDFCVGRFEFMVSEDVRAAVETLLHAKIFGHSFDDACALAAPGTIEMYGLWLANLHESGPRQPASQACEAEGEDPCIANSAAQA